MEELWKSRGRIVEELCGRVVEESWKNCFALDLRPQAHTKVPLTEPCHRDGYTYEVATARIHAMPRCHSISYQSSDYSYSHISLFPVI